MLGIGAVKIHNFIKIRDASFNLSGLGRVLICGENIDEPEKGGNATGKTILGDAIHWLLSGSTTRKIAADKVIGLFDDHCYVEGVIEHGESKTFIGRYRNHPKYGSTLRIKSQGVDVSSGRVSKSQKRLEEILGCSFDLFRLSCFQNSDPRYHFSRMDSTMRARIFDEIIGTSEADVQNRLKKVSAKVREEAKTKIVIDGTIERLNSELELLRQNLQTARSSLQVEQRDHDKHMQRYNDDIRRLLLVEPAPLVAELQEISAKVVEAKKVGVRKEELRNQDSDFMLELARCETKRTSISATASDMHSRRFVGEGVRCKNCGSVVTGDTIAIVKQERDQDIRNLLEQARQNDLKYKEFRDNHRRALKKMSELPQDDEQALSANYFKIQCQLDQIEENISHAKAMKGAAASLESDRAYRKKELEVNVAAIANKIEATKTQLKREQYERTKVDISLDRFEFLSAFYGPSGYRPLAMRYYSPLLSESANHFLHAFTGGHESVVVRSKTQLASGETRDKVEIAVRSNGIEKPFPEAWSKGEGKAIDLSMNFGIMRLAQSEAARDFNFMWMDECTDGLSPQLVQKLFYILSEEFSHPSMTILVTTHRPVDESSFNHVWVMRKQNDECKLEIVR